MPSRDAKAAKRQGFRTIPYGSEGRCWNCGAELPPRRRHYCSDACSDLWYSKFNWNVLKQVAMKRDNYRCVRCGATAEMADMGRGWGLEVHHIIPISEGGAEFDLDNTETLCHRCHVGPNGAHASRKPKRQRTQLVLL